LAEFERSVVAARIGEGWAAGMAAGPRFGRRPATLGSGRGRGAILRVRSGEPPPGRRTPAGCAARAGAPVSAGSLSPSAVALRQSPSVPASASPGKRSGETIGNLEKAHSFQCGPRTPGHPPSFKAESRSRARRPST
jgi:hypothetical protein